MTCATTSLAADRLFTEGRPDAIAGMTVKSATPRPRPPWADRTHFTCRRGGRLHGKGRTVGFPQTRHLHRPSSPNPHPFVRYRWYDVEDHDPEIVAIDDMSPDSARQEVRGYAFTAIRLEELHGEEAEQAAIDLLPGEEQQSAEARQGNSGGSAWPACGELGSHNMGCAPNCTRRIQLTAGPATGRRLVTRLVLAIATIHAE